MGQGSRPARVRHRPKARVQVIRRAVRPPAAAEIVARIGAAGLIAILRLPEMAGATAVARALREAGVSALEVTLTTPEALRGLRPLREAMGPDALLGVGTVLDVTAARAALEAGAQFLVTPILDTGVITLGARRGVPVLPGAFSPTEIYRAWSMGAPLIKVFPAGVLGPHFFRDMRGPFPGIRLVPTGGVTLENVGAFIAAGAEAVAVGGQLADPRLVSAGRWDEIRSRARAFLTLIRRARQAVVAGA